MPMMDTTAIRSLKLHEWPQADQVAWAEACRPGGRLTRGGLACHLTLVTRNDLARRYGQFLDHVVRMEGPFPQNLAAASITPGRVATYVAELRARVASVTVHGSIAKLRRVAELLNPLLELDWLREVENALALEMRPAPKFHRIAASEDIILAGLTLMREAEITRSTTPLKRALLYRNGLMIALLALCPIRLKNYSGLVLDQNLIRLGDNWHIALRAQETKERRPDERPVPAFLTPYIGCYLKTYRPLFKCNSRALWAGQYSKPLSYSAVERVVTETTRHTLGIAISPHLFRTSAASSANMHAGTHPNLASVLLNHRGQKTTQDHYNRANCAYYGQKFVNLIENEGARPRD